MAGRLVLDNRPRSGCVKQKKGVPQVSPREGLVRHCGVFSGGDPGLRRQNRSATEPVGFVGSDGEPELFGATIVNVDGKAIPECRWWKL